MLKTGNLTIRNSGSWSDEYRGFSDSKEADWFEILIFYTLIIDALY